MPSIDQDLVCAQGDSFAFEIDVSSSQGVTADLSGASAIWTLAESWFPGAKVYITKTTPSLSGITIAQISGVWTLTIELLSSDTNNVPWGLLHHEARVTLSDGSVAHVTTGNFNLLPSVSP